MSRHSLLKQIVGSQRRSFGVACSLWWLVLGLTMFGGPAVAAEETGCAGQEMIEEYSIMDILDDRIAQDVRLANVELLKKKARFPACTESQYLLANLYLHGLDLPGNPLPKDTVQARRLLEGYGLEGNAFAFAQLAELALAENDAVEAMQWTQVYLYMVTHYKQSQQADDRRGYNAGLLVRAESAWRKSKTRGDATPKALLNGYFNRSPALAQSVRQQYAVAREDAAAVESETGLGETGLRVKRRSYGGDVGFRIDPGYAIYLMEVQPSGQVSRVAVQTFAPTPNHAKKLRAFVEGWEYHPHRGEKAEIARVPVMYGFDSTQLRSK